jgi:hypothetical protein
MADVCHAAAPNKRDARSSSVIESQIEILSNSARRIERVAVDTKRRETDIVRPFLYGSVEPLYSLLRNLRGSSAVVTVGGNGGKI